MCGIIGVVGSSDTLDTLLEGLTRLEYRGYDSAGVALVRQGQTWRARTAEGTESVSALKEECKKAPRGFTSGIGHTRWATHGAPEAVNAHPHLDCSGHVAIIHNGIIENHAEIRAELEARGHLFSSRTDSEVLAHLVEEARGGGAELMEAVRVSLLTVRGAFAVAAMDATEPDVIVAARRISPLVVGTAPGVTYLASDIPAILDRATAFYAVNDDEIVRMGPEGFRAIDLEGAPVRLKQLTIDWDLETAEKGGFDDFMSKEIAEQPDAIRATLLDRRRKDGTITFDELRVSDDELRDVKRVVLVAAGTSHHAALVAKYAIERWARLGVDVDIASEYRYRDPIVEVGTLVIGVSQSGETIDTIQAAREARRRGARVVAISNIVDSSLARESDAVIYTRAGLEVSVASTKAFVAQVAALELLALRLAQLRQTLSPSDVDALFLGLSHVSAQVAQVLARGADVDDVAKQLLGARDFFFLGRHVGFPTALEGALKLKELSYLHAEGYPAGELKHGPLALIEPGVVVVAVATDPAMHEKLLSNLAEVKARGATVVAVATDDDEKIEAVADYVLRVPVTEPMFTPMIDIVPLQLFAYAMARGLGKNVDRPRNLAKTVTVE
ncbi:MAG TPA: glutamine--fructose-6-phosphate transaminase (isomerizing) [Acidimicrobiales bacterium]|nr:MAG: glutamine--fructose-6-phosphate transaminase (isomerizing) [Actinobacteria bacterium 21-64-8]HQT99582.1 glutamine--fructose-6-phosphate transaminase (isomerizing) [Acidimicrobiales bacterium]